MTECKIFELLDVDPYDEEAKQNIDADAIIRDAQKNPRDIDVMYSFSTTMMNYGHCSPPLHQAIVLGLGVEVINALTTPTAIRKKAQFFNSPPPCMPISKIIRCDSCLAG